MAKLATVGGVSGIGFLILGLGLPKVIENLPAVVSYGLTAVGGILLLTTFVWSLLNRGGADSASFRQKTGGPHSPNIRADGNVTINYGASPAEPAPPAESPWDDPNFSLSDPSSWRAHGQEPIPDMTVREVCDRLYNSLGGPTQLITDFERRVELEIKDAVKFQKLHTWGRRGPTNGLDVVWREAWINGDFDHKTGVLAYRHPDNQMNVVTWIDLRFNRKEVDKWLPPSPQMIII